MGNILKIAILLPAYETSTVCSALCFCDTFHWISTQIRQSLEWIARYKNTLFIGFVNDVIWKWSKKLLKQLVVLQPAADIYYVNWRIPHAYVFIVNQTVFESDCHSNEYPMRKVGTL